MKRRANRGVTGAQLRRVLDSPIGSTTYLSLIAHGYRLRVMAYAKAHGVWHDDDWGRLLHRDSAQMRHLARLCGAAATHTGREMAKAEA